MSEKRDQTLLGLVPWRPRKGSAAAHCLEDVLGILDKWVASGVVPSLTTRAILYRLLPLGWSKADEDHPLGYVLERARRAGLIPFEWIADGRSETFQPRFWRSADAFRAAVQSQAEQFRLDPLRGQPHIEIWVESAGMVQMLERLANELGTPIHTSSGMNTLRSKYEAAGRLMDNGEGSVILFVGDLDPWGETRYQNVRDDVVALCEDSGQPAAVEFATVALTAEQVVQHAIPTEPAKAAVRAGKKGPLPRGWQEGDPTAQAEALPPDLLLAAVREAVVEHVDEDLRREMLADEEAQRAELLVDFGRDA